MEKGRKFSDIVVEKAIEQIAALLADRIADGVVKALLEAGLDKKLAIGIIEALKREVEGEEDK